MIESPSWDDEIAIIARNERVSGGQDGIANRPLKTLANRTRYLKQASDKALGDLSGKVSAVKTFSEGAVLDSPRDEILYGNYRMVWTGDFPKVVPADSTPDNTGGTGAGAWAYTSDAPLRTEMRATGDKSGGTLLYLKHGETAQDAIKFVTPLTKSGVENAEYNYQLVQSLLNKGLHVDLKMGDIYFSQPVQTRKGQIIKGQGAPNFSPYCYTRVICLSEGGGLFLVYRRLIYRTGQDAADYQYGAGRRLPCPL